MKRRIKLFEEYRAMGFQYSEPKELFTLMFSLEDTDVLDLDETIIEVLTKNDIKYDSVEVDGWDIEIDVKVYTEREIQAIVDSVLKSLARKRVMVDTDTIEIEPK